MSIEYRHHVDSRDGTIYPCVLMPDGKWWSAVNLRWAGGERRAPGNNEANVETHGWLYLDTLASGYVPEGTHLPSTYAWSMAGLTYADFVSKTVAGGLDTYGLNILMAGYSGYSFGTSAEFSGVYSDWVYFNGSSRSASIGPGTGDYVSVRFIVDVFNEPPPPFDFTQITSASNFQLQTANSQFQSESKGYRTLGSQGLPIITANVVWDLATAAEETSFRNWFDAETPWDHDNFPGIGNVTIQAKGLPKYTRTVRGLSISLDVAIFPNKVAPSIVFPEFPTLVNYTGIEAGYSHVSNRAVVSTSGRTSLRTPIGERGETYDISWKTSLAGAIQFFEWFASIGNGRKQFFASICGKIGWLWKIVGSYRFDIDVDMVRISMSVNGRDVRRGIQVSIVKSSNTKITGSFSGSGVRAFLSIRSYGLTLALPLSVQSTTELTIDPSFISTWGPYLGDVKIIVVDGEHISDWKDWNFK